MNSFHSLRYQGNFLPFLFLFNLHTLVSAYTTIPADSLAKWLQCGAAFGYILIDVRDTVEVRSSTGIIADDSVRPYHLSLNQGVFAGESGRIPSAAPVVIYCRTGNRSATAARTLTERGYTAVYHLGSGIAGWTGSRRDASYIQPISWLPQFSCRKSSTALVRTMSSETSGQFGLGSP